MMKIRMTDVVAPSFYKIYKDIISEKHTHYYFYGGRGGTKSTFVGVAIIMLLLQDPSYCFVTFRKVSDTLTDSVKAQIMWAIDKLGLNNYFVIPKSLQKITYMPTGQVIYFRGLDDPKKRKSFRLPPGKVMKAVWFEEYDEFKGPEEIRSVIQSLGRGTEGKILYFYSWNPPSIADHWVYKEAEAKRDDKLSHYSTYLQVPKEWLGPSFIAEAEYLKQYDELRYRHEYLGEPIDFRGIVFHMLSEHHMIDELPRDEKIQYYLMGIDGAIERDATAGVVLGVTTKGRLIRTHLFYYDPQAKGNYPLAPSQQVDLLVKWLKKQEDIKKENTLFIFDSASSDLRREFEFRTKANAIVIEKKSIERDTARVQNLLAQETLLFKRIKDFVDPKTDYVTYDYDPLIFEMRHYTYHSERVGKILDGQQDHAIDALKYATYYFGHPKALHRPKMINIENW